MSDHPTDFKGDVLAAIRGAIEQAIPGARVDVAGGGGHFTIEVVSPAFEGKTMLASHRLVLAAVAPLMKGPMAPVHAVDTVKTRTA
jgi:acid stress-induced BolA-like protein IbaG/YrbA